MGELPGFRPPRAAAGTEVLGRTSGTRAASAPPPEAGPRSLLPGFRLPALWLGPLQFCWKEDCGVEMRLNG